MKQLQNDEIDFFDLFQTLWHGKWLISGFVAVSLLLGGIYSFHKKKQYESKLIFSIDTFPPFYSQKKASIDFTKKFYSIRVFENWKENYGKPKLRFENFSITEQVNGFVLSKETMSLANLMSDKKKGLFILVKTNNLLILDELFKYSEYINGLLKTEYVARAKDELNIIETRFKDFSTANDAIISQILNIDRYIVSAQKGAKVFTIQRPTNPKDISTKPFQIYMLSVVLGGVIGVLSTLFRYAIKIRKEKSAIS